MKAHWCRKPWLLATTLLLAHVAGYAQSGRVDTGMRLRMTNSLSAGAPNLRTGAAVSATTVTPARKTTEKTAAPIFRGVTLRLTSGLRFDDNVLRTDRFQQRDVIVVMRPSIYIDGRLGRHTVRAGYEFDSERYLRLSSQSEPNHAFFLGSDLDLGRRMKSSIKSTLTYGADSPGDIDTRPGIRRDRDRWREHSVGGDITFGRRIARAQIGAGYNVRGLRYLNNNQQERDYDQRDLTLFGRYNLGPKYALVTNLSAAWIDYHDPGSNLDSRQYNGLFGLEWEATAKTSGIIQFGLLHLDPDDPGQSSSNNFSWDARVTWAPKTYSKFTAYSSRTVSQGGFIDGQSDAATISDTWGLLWRHGLSERTTFEASVERTLASAAGRVDGDDEYMAYGAGLRYRLNRWVDVFAEWDFNSRSSRSPGSDYEASSVFIGFDASLDHAFQR